MDEIMANEWIADAPEVPDQEILAEISEILGLAESQ
jgi:hypothetical protein